MSNPRYVALGSSFASGPFIGKRVEGSPPAAGRSSANYAHLLAGKLGYDLVDVTYSGVTAAEIAEGPAIEAVTGETMLVTVTCGGNDVGYLPGLMRPFGTRQEPETEALAATFDRLTAQVRRRAPRARLFLVDYLTILPPAGNPFPLSRNVAEWGRRTAQAIADTTAQAAARAGCDYLSASTASIDHHAWSRTPWTRRLWPSRHDGAPYHPNAAGMQAVARLLAEALR